MLMSIVTNAATIWTLLCIAGDVQVSDITHIPGVDNDHCDQLSRRGQAPTLSLAAHATLLGIGNAPVIGLEGDADAAAHIGLCQPTLPTDSDAHFLAFWRSAQSHIDNFIARHSQHSRSDDNAAHPSDHQACS